MSALEKRDEVKENREEIKSKGVQIFAEEESEQASLRIKKDNLKGEARFENISE